MTIGRMNRKVVFLNSLVVKSPSGGTTTEWDEWGEEWCEYKRRDGSISGNGGQQNLLYNAEIKVHYSTEVETYLNKDTVAKIDGNEYRVIDFINNDNIFFSIKCSSQEKGTTKQTTSNMKNFLFEAGAGVADEEGADYFISSVLKNRTIIAIESLRAVPMEVITVGSPADDEVLYTAATGRIDVIATTPFTTGEKMNVIFK